MADHPSRSCDTCNKRKVKCNRSYPECSECARAGLQCSYTRPSKKRGRPLSASSAPSITPAVSSNAPPPNEVHEELMKIFFQFIKPILPIIHKNTFSTATAPPLLVNAIYAYASTYSDHPSCRSPNDIPWDAGEPFYRLAKNLLNDNIEEPALSTVQALLILSNYACASGKRTACQLYATLATRMAQELRLNIETEFDDEMYPTPLSWLERETQRRVWWCCYIIDHYGTAHGDRTAAIQDHDCKVYLPCSELVWHSVQTSTDVPLDDMKRSISEIALFTSSVPFVAGIQFSSIYAHTILLTKIFCKVTEYRAALKNKYRGIKPIPFPSAGDVEMDQQLVILNTSLHEWMASLPEWARQTPDSFREKLNYPSAQSLWDTACLHIFYHTTIGLLHRTNVVESFLSTNTHIPSGQYQVYMSAAIAVTEILQSVMIDNPNLHYMSPIMGFCTYQAAIAHLMTTQMAKNSDEMNVAHQSLVVHIMALQTLGRYWYGACRFYVILRILIQGLKTPLSPNLSLLLAKEVPALNLRKSVLTEPHTIRMHAKAERFFMKMREINGRRTASMIEFDGAPPSGIDAPLPSTATFNGELTSLYTASAMETSSSSEPSAVAANGSEVPPLMEQYSNNVLGANTSIWMDFFVNDLTEDMMLPWWGGTLDAMAAFGEGDPGERVDTAKTGDQDDGLELRGFGSV